MSINKRIDKALNDLNVLIKEREERKKYKGILKEISPETLALFPAPGQKRFKSIYLQNRIRGVDVQKSATLATKLIARASKGDMMSLLNNIEKELKKTKENFFSEDQQAENWGAEFAESPDEEKKEKECSGRKEDNK